MQYTQPSGNLQGIAVPHQARTSPPISARGRACARLAEAPVRDRAAWGPLPPTSRAPGDVRGAIGCSGLPASGARHRIALKKRDGPQRKGVLRAIACSGKGGALVASRFRRGKEDLIAVSTKGGCQSASEGGRPASSAVTTLSHVFRLRTMELRDLYRVETFSSSGRYFDRSFPGRAARFCI